MAYQEVKTTSYGSRVGNSFKSIGTGVLLFLGGTALLWWNEGRAVKTEKMLNDAEKACVVMENPEKMDRTLEGELVCATAVANTTDSLSDSQFGVGATAIALKRNVEYYQWVEHSSTKKEDKVGGKEVETTTYTYTQEWVKKPVDSGKFHDPAYQGRNTVRTKIEDQEQWAQNVTFGTYKLNENQIKSISSTEPLDLAYTDEQLMQMGGSMGASQQNMGYNQQQYNQQYSQTYNQSQDPYNQGQQTYNQNQPYNQGQQPYNQPYNQGSYAGNVPSGPQMVHQSGNQLYYGASPNAPQIGDVKVKFEKVVPAKVTIIAEVSGDTFKAFKAKNGKTFQTLVMGQKTADEIFESEHASNSMWLWIWRIVGIGLVISGLKGIFKFLETLLKVVPFVANIVGFGVGIVCSVIGFVWSLIIIALAWVFYRPVLGITLLVIAGFLVWVFAFKGKEKLKQLTSKKEAEEPQTQPEVQA